MRAIDIQIYPKPWHNRLLLNILKTLLKKQQQQIRFKNYPSLACFPIDAIGQQIIMHGLYEEELLRVLFNVTLRDYLPQFKEQAVLDGGANIGNHSLFFSRYFKQVIAFEPNPTSLKLLDANIFFNKTENIQIISTGLSNKSETLSFVEVPENLGGSGFYFNLENPLPFDKPTIRQLNVEEGDILLEKQVKTSIKIALIKLDIEGYELNALIGLEKSIKKHQPIILFEATTSEGVFGSKSIFSYLSEFNYSYFYTLEEKKSHPFFLIRFFELLKGFRIVLNQITLPEDRYYPLIIATTTPLK